MFCFESLQHSAVYYQLLQQTVAQRLKIDNLLARTILLFSNKYVLSNEDRTQESDRNGAYNVLLYIRIKKKRKQAFHPVCDYRQTRSLNFYAQ